MTALGQPDDPWPALELLQNFLQNVQGQPPPPSNEWVQVGKPGVDPTEHAAWLTAREIEQILGNELSTFSIKSVDFFGKSNTEQLRIIASQQNRYFALIRHDGRFETLLDRRRLIDGFLKARNIK